ncbi:MAG: polysaccharide pyruvyl transferase family protein [Butyrivibrio sp.]|nr:polysaccharide pyruvyl transferase family protein [Butyrivibrio sp.]
MLRLGTVSYNIYANFTNYGSALQTWALHQAVKKTGNEPVLVDYCPDILADKDPLNPYANMWDKNDEARRMVELSLPAIRANYDKFDAFYHDEFTRTSKKYTSANFDDILENENLDGFVCGSDTIFCPDEFGFDDGYYANYDVMKGQSVSYAASFGDPHFDEDSYKKLDDRLGNFRALGIRENQMIPYIKEHTSVPTKRTIDPTLLLDAKEYAPITGKNGMTKKYLLLYSRRYTPVMEKYAEKIAKENGWEIVDISLRATNSERGHIMRYDAGVQEFLSLVQNAEFVVTNSFHGMIFSVQFRRPFVVFSRQQCDNKIEEVLDLFGLSDRLAVSKDCDPKPIDYDLVHENIDRARKESFDFLKMELGLL